MTPIANAGARPAGTETRHEYVRVRPRRRQDEPLANLHHLHSLAPLLQAHK